jgi:hypothetical protein
MGAWGTAISSNDTFEDIYADFFDLYNDGLEVAEISKWLIDNNKETIDDPDDSDNFWFALAKAQWQCKQLDESLYERVKEIIETDANIEIWRQLGAEEKEIKKRKLVLEKFLKEISSEKPKAKPRKKKIIRQPIFEKGDCITFQFDNGNYGGVVVLEAIKDTELGMNLIATTRINQQNKPSLEDFTNSNVLVKSFPNWKEQRDIRWYYAQSFNKENINLEKIGTLEVQIDYDPKDYKSDFMYGGSAGSFKLLVTRQLEYEKTNNNPVKIVTLKELIRRTKDGSKS